MKFSPIAISMIPFLAAVLATVGATGQDAEQQGKLFWIFLTTGKSTNGVPNEEIQEMQSQHLANFKRLADEGKLLSAGPVADPEKELRGIVVVRARDQAELSAMFQADPYITAGYMNLEATEMEIVHGTIRTRITPSGLDEFRIAVIEESDTHTNSERSGPGAPEFIKQLQWDNEVLLSVRLQENVQGRLAVMIMKKPADEQIFAAKINAIPAIIEGNLKSRIIPLYLGKGSFTPS